MVGVRKASGIEAEWLAKRNWYRLLRLSGAFSCPLLALNVGGTVIVCCRHKTSHSGTVPTYFFAGYLQRDCLRGAVAS